MAATRWAGCNLFSHWIYVLKKIPPNIKRCVHIVKSGCGKFWSICHIICKQTCARLHNSPEMTVACLISGFDEGSDMLSLVYRELVLQTAPCNHYFLLFFSFSPKLLHVQFARHLCYHQLIRRRLSSPKFRHKSVVPDAFGLQWPSITGSVSVWLMIISQILFKSQNKKDKTPLFQQRKFFHKTVRLSCLSP